MISFVYLEPAVSQITRFSFPRFRMIHYHSLLPKASHGKRKMIGKRKTSAGLRRILSCSHRPSSQSYKESTILRFSYPTLETPLSKFSLLLYCILLYFTFLTFISFLMKFLFMSGCWHGLACDNPSRYARLHFQRSL